MPSISKSFGRGILVWILGVTVAPLAILFWLGGRFLDHERELVERQARERIEQAADRVVVDLQRAMNASLQRLAAGEREWPEGSVAITFRRGFVAAHPRDRVAYLPVAPLKEAPADVFAAGDSAEFRQRDRASAIRIFEELSRSPDSAVRVGALLRLGPNLERNGRAEEALQAYSRVTGADDVGYGGVPAALAAIYLRCELLERQQRGDALREEVRRLSDALKSSRWPLTEAVYRSYAQYAARWVDNHADEKPLFADAIAALWKQWRADAPSPGQSRLRVDGEDLTVLWQTEGETHRALVARQEFVESQWLPQARLHAGELNVAFSLGEPASRNVAPVVRRNAETGLPWDVATIALDPSAYAADFAFRRRLLIGGFALLAVLALTAGYMIFRAVRRESAAASLQSAFVAAVSHEFRTPLTALRQFTSMLRDQPALGEERRRLAYDAQWRATDRLVSLVDSVLDFGRIEAGAHLYRIEKQDCASLTRRVVDEFQPEAQGADHNVIFHSDGSAEIDVDAESFSRALRNLLENAVKYSPGGRVVDVTQTCAGGHARIAVRDRGIGVPRHERTKIFARFQRGDEARLRGIRGTGIGLAMVDEIVKAHRGRVELESPSDGGSIFTIVLPLNGGQES